MRPGRRSERRDDVVRHPLFRLRMSSRPNASSRPPAPPGQPYAMRLADGRTLAVEGPGRYVVKDRTGEVCFTPEGVRFLDRLRSLFMPLDRPPSPGFLRTLREA